MEKKNAIFDPGSRRLPRYFEIKTHLLEQIRSNALKPNDKTESENELARRFDVSRLTVQRAVRELVAEGRLKRVQGSGTFVASRPTGFSLFEVRDVAEQIRQQGGDPHSEILIHRQTSPEVKIREELELDEGQPVFEVVMVRKNGEVPVAIESRYLRCEVYPDFLSHDFEEESLYDYLSRHSKLGELKTRLSAIIPAPLMAQRLHLAAGDPCLLLERHNRVGGKVLTFSSFLFAGSRLSLESTYEAH